MRGALLGLLLMACGVHNVPVLLTPTIEPLPTSAIVRAISADSVFHKAFAELHARYPDKETALCLYGVVNQSGEAVLLFTRPAPIDSASISYVRISSPCFRPEPKYFGALRYLGIVHNHPNNMCQPSEPDISSFRRDVDAVIEMVVCNAGLVAVARGK